MSSVPADPVHLRLKDLGEVSVDESQGLRAVSVVLGASMLLRFDVVNIETVDCWEPNQWTDVRSAVVHELHFDHFDE